MKKFIKVITLVLAFSMCLSVAACDFTTVQTLLPEELIELIFNTAERVGGYNSVPQKTFNGEGTIYYNAQKWATEEFLQNNLTYNWLHRTETADLPEFITHIVTEKQAFDEIFPAFPKTIDFDNEVAIVYCFNDNYMGEPYGLKEIKINGEELSISIDRWHVSGTGTMTSPQQRVFVITLQKISFAKVTISFGECLVTEEEMAEELADELSISELKAGQSVGAQYNEFGKFYEKPSTEMLFFREMIWVSSLYRFEMCVFSDEEGAVCEFSANYGVLVLPENGKNADRTLTIAPLETSRGAFIKYWSHRSVRLKIFKSRFPRLII